MTWQQSSYSMGNGDCVEVWRRSSRSMSNPRVDGVTVWLGVAGGAR